MPTTRPRYQVTETPQIAHALDLAAARWPDEPRSKLLLRLVDLGSRTVEHEQRTANDSHRTAVLASSGRYDVAFAPDYLDELRADWPR